MANMRTKSYKQIEHAEQSDIGKIALISGNTLAIEDTVEECLATALSCGMQSWENNELRPMNMEDITHERSCMIFLITGEE